MNNLIIDKNLLLFIGSIGNVLLCVKNILPQDMGGAITAATIKFYRSGTSILPSVEAPSKLVFSTEFRQTYPPRLKRANLLLFT